MIMLPEVLPFLSLVVADKLLPIESILLAIESILSGMGSSFCDVIFNPALILWKLVYFVSQVHADADADATQGFLLVLHLGITIDCVLGIIWDVGVE